MVLIIEALQSYKTSSDQISGYFALDANSNYEIVHEITPSTLIGHYRRQYSTIGTHNYFRFNVRVEVLV